MTCGKAIAVERKKKNQKERKEGLWKSGKACWLSHFPHKARRRSF